MKGLWRPSGRVTNDEAFIGETSWSQELAVVGHNHAETATRRFTPLPPSTPCVAQALSGLRPDAFTDSGKWQNPNVNIVGLAVCFQANMEPWNMEQSCLAGARPGGSGTCISPGFLPRREEMK